MGGCIVPVYWSGDSNDVQAGFAAYPGGALVGGRQTLNATGSATYDAAAGRWLPVGPEAISPDGSQFAYAEYDLPPGTTAGMISNGDPHFAGALATTGRVHVMDARTGIDRVLYSGSPTYRVVGFTTDGIYLSQVLITMDGEFASGLYLLSSLTDGPPAPVIGGDRVLDRGGWTIFNGAAWGTEFSAGGGITGGNELVELDLHTSILTTWLTEPVGTGVFMHGFDSAGEPLVTAFATGYSETGSPAPTPPTQFLLLTAPKAVTVLWQGRGEAEPPVGPAFTDSKGSWLGGQSGLWLVANGDTSRVPVSVPQPDVFPGAVCL